jgi:hypothetical protein
MDLLVPRAMLLPEQSATLREQLITELKDVSSADEAANWAHRIMATKNTLRADDAERVERAFQERLASATMEVETSAAQKIKKPVRRKKVGPKFWCR